jgi:acetyl-CoA C-acetyltransferase
MLDAYVFDGLRTPFGRHGGALSSVRPDDLVAHVIKALVARGGFAASEIDDVVVGCATQAGEDSRNVSRRAALLAGLPIEIPGTTVNRLCASGLEAIIVAARTVAAGEGDLLIAGGVESMSRAPFVMGKAEQPFSRELKVFDSTIGSRFPNPRFTEVYGDHAMPETAEEVARDLGISREESDRFALASQQHCAKAKQEGFFEGELVAIDVSAEKSGGKGIRHQASGFRQEAKGRSEKEIERGEATLVTEDEPPRPDTTLEKLARLKPIFAGGVVTAGNASGINDGAAAVLVGSRQFAERTGSKPLARIVASAAAGVEPRVMGLGPVPASRKALSRAGLTLADMDVIEINEAFAPQVLGCLKLMELCRDDSRVNPNGGAIAIGHPLGASGARLLLTAVRQLERAHAKYALVTLCIGVGQGLAAVVERVA